VWILEKYGRTVLASSRRNEASCQKLGLLQTVLSRKRISERRGKHDLDVEAVKDTARKLASSFALWGS
jgi:hypothetical protein